MAENSMMSLSISKDTSQVNDINNRQRNENK